MSIEELLGAWSHGWVFLENHDSLERNLASLKSRAIKQEIQREVYKDRKNISGCVGPVGTAGGCGDAGDCSRLYGVGMVAHFCDYITYHYLYTWVSTLYGMLIISC